MTQPYELRNYPGAAADTTLAFGIGAADLQLTVAAGTGVGYPVNGPYFIVIDYDTSAAEKLHVSSRVGDNFFLDARGADGTVASAHSVPAKIRACWTATDAQEANKAAHETVGRVTARGDLLTGSSANTLAKLAVGADGSQLTADSTQPGGAKWLAPSTAPTITDFTHAVHDHSSATEGGIALNDSTITGANMVGVELDVNSTVAGVTGTQIAADHAVHGTLPLSGHLATTVPPSSLTTSGTVFTIALTAGTWLLNVGCHANQSGGSGAPGANLTISTSLDSGLTAAGKLTSTIGVQSNDLTTHVVDEDFDMYLTMIVVATVNGSVTINYAGAGGTAGWQIIGGAGASSGYTAVRVA